MIDLKLVLLVLVLAALTLPVSAAQNLFSIADAGRAKAAIVLADDAPIADQTAAKELSFYLNRATGADFRIYSPGNAPSAMPRIWLGQNPDTTRMLRNIDWSSLKFDGIVIRFVGRDLVLAGDKPRGTLYAVYTFLEEYIGFRWWTAKAFLYPYKTTLAVERRDKKHIPPFMYRETYYQPVNHKNLEFASKLKLNGTHQSVPDEFGGHYNLLGFVHTFDKFLPASEYFDKHPEWFSLRNGVRIGGQMQGQLCLTNQEMKAEFIKKVMEEIAKDPGAGMIAIDQNDNFAFCQCENCTAVAEEEGGQSGLLIQFVNDVADAVKEKYPDFLVETLAYQYTRHAPTNIKPRDNVIVRLCSIECDFSTPLDSKNNESFYKDLKDWGKISKRMYIWDYVVNFANLSLPFPNWRVLRPNLNIFADNHVVGMFEQGDGFNKDASFGNMKIWVMSQLMWDRTLNQKKLMNEFANGYYGAAGPYLIKYLDLISNAVEKHNVYLGCFIGSNMEYLGQSEMNSANKLFDQAEKSVANDAELLLRVRIERLALDHAWILQTMLDRSQAGKARGMDMMQICENFITMSQATGNDYIYEGGKMPEGYYDSLRSFASMPYVPIDKVDSPVPEAAKGLKADQWADMQESRMSLYLPGVKSFIVGDMEASDHRAIRMPGGQLDWAAQMFLERAKFPAGTSVEVHMVVKAETKATSGPAFTIGIYDTLSGRRILDRTVKIEDIAGPGYQDYNLGTYKLEPGWYVYVASPGDANQVENVFVDRGYIIKR